MLLDYNDILPFVVDRPILKKQAPTEPFIASWSRSPR